MLGVVLPTCTRTMPSCRSYSNRLGAWDVSAVGCTVNRLSLQEITAVQDTVATALVDATRSEADQRLVFGLRSGPPSARSKVGSHGRPRATGHYTICPKCLDLSTAD